MAAKPELTLMTGLPLVWGETGPFDPASRPAAAYASLRREFAVRPIDYLDAPALGDSRLLLLAQPRTLAPAGTGEGDRRILTFSTRENPALLDRDEVIDDRFASLARLLDAAGGKCKQLIQRRARERGPLGGGLDLVLGWEQMEGLRWPALTGTPRASCRMFASALLLW